LECQRRLSNTSRADHDDLVQRNVLLSFLCHG
jgi:hypothetical protein